MPWQQNSGSLNITALLSIFLISSPLIALIAEFLISFALNRKIPSFRIIDPNHQDTVSKNISDDSERTSIEFQKYFTDLVSVITDSENERFGKLVIVIDNIDRLSHEHIRQSWATMQAFLQHRNSASQGKFLEKKVWFILPYDREILAEALEPPEKQEITPSHIDSPISFLQRNTSSRRLMALEKSIQIQVETPEPVMSGWAKYLDACIDSALDWSPEEIEKVKEEVKASPRKYVAQPIMSLSVHPTYIDETESFEQRHVDLRTFTVLGKDKEFVLKGGLTRVALKRGNLIVNSSQGGGSKDTWVLKK